jgi:hypothetical protein
VTTGHREHLLQAAIGTDPSLLGVSHLRRELPAWRPKVKPRSGRAFIDFIARDVDRVGHGIETKIGPDAQLGFQALDYWAWAEAHRAELAGTIEADPNRRSSSTSPSGCRTNEPPPCCRRHLAGLHTSISWRCHLVSSWDTVAQPVSSWCPRPSLWPRACSHLSSRGQRPALLSSSTP